MNCNSISGRSTEQAVKVVVLLVKIYKLPGMTNKIRGNIINACRGQLLPKCQPMKFQKFQVLLPFGWGEKEGRVLEHHSGPEELQQPRSHREAVEASWHQSTMFAHIPNGSKKNLNVPKTASRQTDGDGKEASNRSPFLFMAACCCL